MRSVATCGGCGLPKRVELLACVDCLARMPPRLIDAVKATYDDSDLYAHAVAVDRARTWLARHFVTAPSGRST